MYPSALENMKDILTKIVSMKMGPAKGIAVILGEDEHVLASYSGAGRDITLKDMKTVESSSLREISRKAPMLSLCFSPRGIYSDVGEFSCISKEATTAHIRATVDKIGLFRDDYCITFTKIQDIDNLKSKYSYLAIPLHEMNKTELLDEKEALVYIFCPIEASIATAVGTVDPNMVIIVYEDTRFVRIIGAKAGVIYYLITIHSAESFDALADTVAGVREMTSMLLSSYQEKPQKVYAIGQGEISISDLEKHDVHAEPFSLNEYGKTDPQTVVLLGTALNPCYDFTPERLHRTRRIVGYAKISFAVSMVMIMVSALYFALGWSNAINARSYEKKTHAATYKSSQELKVLEDDYASLSKNLNLTNINNIIETYKDFQAEPKLQSIMETISQRVPKNVFITKIEVTRATTQEGMPQARVAPAAANAQRTSHAKSFDLVIQGIINLSFPQSKEVFSSFIMAVQEVYKVSKAEYVHKENGAEFSLNCEMKL